jgi:hypothetical protein
LQITSHPNIRPFLRLAFPLFLVVLTIIFGWMSHIDSETVAAANFAPMQWAYALPVDLCPGGDHDDCHAGSPALADINGDGYDDVVAVTNKGHIVALTHDGSLLWDTDVAPYFNMPAGTNEIHSSPAIADIDADGYPEIVVGVGTYQPDVCTVGGVIVLNHLGHVEPGWPIIGFDSSISPEGCPDTFFATPALGDMDNDGDLEIVSAGFDKRIYAWHHDGSLLPGYPPSSHHAIRFPQWQDFKGQLGDMTWGSPALVDLDNDGYLDMIIATGEGNFDDRWGGDSGGWSCPYRLPAGWAPGYCGGSIYAFNRFGEVMPGFPRYFLEALGSTPAVADTNGDGLLEIYVGTSSFYYNYSPDHPRYGFKLFGLDTRGNDLPGWEGGKDLGGATPASPSIGDIAGDEQMEIIIAADDLKLYAFHSDGNSVAGFPMKPLTQTGKSYLKYEHGVSFPLADYDSDGKMEIFLNQTWVVVVVDGNGQQLTSTNYPYDQRPTYYAGGNLFNTPALGDIDNDGRLELVVTNSNVSVWDLPDSQDLAHWSNFKCDSARVSRYCQRLITLWPPQVTILHQVGAGSNATYSTELHNTGINPVGWSASFPQTFSISPSAGTVATGVPAELTVSIPTSGLSKGTYHLGSYQITPEGDEYLAKDLDQDVTLVIGDLTYTFLPIFTR